MRLFLFSCFLFISASFFTATAQDSAKYTNTEIIYGRKDGLAMTMLKLAPKQNSNGKAIISLVSGNWVSSYARAANFEKGATIYLNRGYTVFLVIHGTQPRYAIPDIVSDVKRSVRFIRYHAKEYGIDGEHIGITGYSSGGHIALETATTDDTPDPKAQDPVDRVSSRVQAAGVFFPPSDFLNFGGQKTNAAGNRQLLAAIGVAGAFDFTTYDATTKTYQLQSDSMRAVTAKAVSPIYSVTHDDPPTLIIHGDADMVVPISQTEALIKKFKEADVPNDFIVVKGKGHGWPNMDAEINKQADWFDKYLK